MKNSWLTLNPTMNILQINTPRSNCIRIFALLITGNYWDHKSYTHHPHGVAPGANSAKRRDTELPLDSGLFQWDPENTGGKNGVLSQELGQGPEGIGLTHRAVQFLG